MAKDDGSNKLEEFFEMKITVADDKIRQLQEKFKTLQREQQECATEIQRLGIERQVAARWLKDCTDTPPVGTQTILIEVGADGAGGDETEAVPVIADLVLEFAQSQIGAFKAIDVVTHVRRRRPGTTKPGVFNQLTKLVGEGRLAKVAYGVYKLIQPGSLNGSHKDVVEVAV